MVVSRVLAPWVLAAVLVGVFRVVEADRGTLIAILAYGVLVVAADRALVRLAARRSRSLVGAGAPVEAADVPFDDELWDRPGAPDRPRYLWQVSAFFATAIAIDAMWFTNWLDFATGTSRYTIVSDWTAAVTITITMICVAVAYAGPLVLGARTYIEARAELVHRREAGGTATMRDDFTAVVPTVVAVVVGFGHFALAWSLYAALT